MTSTKKMAVAEDLDFLAIVSGPEPQRTKLEEIIMKQVQTSQARRWSSWEARKRSRTERWTGTPLCTPTSPQKRRQS